MNSFIRLVDRIETVLMRVFDWLDNIELKLRAYVIGKMEDWKK